MSIDTTNSTESLTRSTVPLATGQAVAVTTQRLFIGRLDFDEAGVG